MLRRGSCSQSHCPDAGAVHEVVPARADACAKEHGENRAKTVGSQLQAVHGRRLKVHSPVTNGWERSAPVPISPPVMPMVPVPAPPAALGDQLDRRRANGGLARRVVGRRRRFFVRQVDGWRRWTWSERGHLRVHRRQCSSVINNPTTARIAASVGNMTLTVEVRRLTEAKAFLNAR